MAPESSNVVLPRDIERVRNILQRSCHRNRMSRVICFYRRKSIVHVPKLKTVILKDFFVQLDI